MLVMFISNDRSVNFDLINAAGDSNEKLIRKHILIIIEDIVWDKTVPCFGFFFISNIVTLIASVFFFIFRFNCLDNKKHVNIQPFFEVFSVEIPSFAS